MPLRASGVDQATKHGHVCRELLEALPLCGYDCTAIELSELLCVTLSEDRPRIVLIKIGIISDDYHHLACTCPCTAFRKLLWTFVLIVSTS